MSSAFRVRKKNVFLSKKQLFAALPIKPALAYEPAPSTSSERKAPGDDGVEAVPVVGRVGDGPYRAVGLQHRVLAADAVAVALLPGGLGVARAAVHHAVVVRVPRVDLHFACGKKESIIEALYTRGESAGKVAGDLSGEEAACDD